MPSSHPRQDETRLSCLVGGVNRIGDKSTLFLLVLTAFRDWTKHFRFSKFFVADGPDLSPILFTPNIWNSSVGLLLDTRRIRSRTDEREHGRGPRVSGGLKFAKCGPISGDFRPFSTVFRQNGGRNYFVSGFLFRIEFLVMVCIENDRHIDIVSWRIFEI